MKTLILMQGIPGSGKSTVAAALVSTMQGVGHLFSTDEFWYRLVENGIEYHGREYKFDPTRLSEAHEWNQKRTEVAMGTGHPIVIDNTNIKREHVIPYLVLAAKYGYTVQVVRVTTDPAIAAARNTHGVPAEVVFRMHQEMEDLLGT